MIRQLLKELPDLGLLSMQTATTDSVQGIIPDDLKSARVVPVFKKSDKIEVLIYRPISILSIISNVFERAVYDQVETYLDQKKLLYKFHPGLRSRFSTDTCLVHLTDFYKVSSG